MKKNSPLVAAPTLIAVVTLLSVASLGFADRRPARPQPAAASGMVNLPYTHNDNAGNQWMLYQGGMLRQQGNMPLYSQAAMLMVNGNHATSNQNQAKRDEKSGEIIFDLTIPGGAMVTRRILFASDGAYVRYIDVFRNTQGQPLQLNVMYQTHFNYGVQSSTTVNDPKGKDRTLAWVAQMQAGRALMEIFGGRGVKTSPRIEFMPENNMVRAVHQLDIPAGREAAILHLHGTVASQDAGTTFVESLRDNKLLADIPAALRKIIVNFGGASTYIDDREILRGDLFDVVELRGGDIVRGTLKETVFQLQTFYGKIELPAERVVALINVGQHRPRQLLVTSDGEVFGGNLAKETLEMQLSSGQVTQIPLSQISRAGYRKRTGEPEEFTFNKPMALLRSGERVGIVMSEQPIEILTRYGALRINPKTISAIALQAEDHGVHAIHLTDGSSFAGLLTAPLFELKLSGAGGQTVSFPTSTLRQIQFTGEIQEPDDEAPVLLLSNDDSLVGSIAGELKLDTTFDTITIDGAEVRTLTHAPETPLDVQVTLWDQTSVSGQLQDQELACVLLSGISVKVPVALVAEYTNPNPKPSDSMVERIRLVVAELSADDWQQRERAEKQLVEIGPVVAGVLRELLPTQPPEAQQRIESVLKQLNKANAPPTPVVIEE